MDQGVTVMYRPSPWNTSGISSVIPVSAAMAAGRSVSVSAQASAVESRFFHRFFMAEILLI